jgi:hypothetical protein
MTPNRLFEIKGNLPIENASNLSPEWRAAVGDLIKEVERLMARQDELLAANNAEVEHRREAQLRLMVVCENADAFIRHSQDALADLRDMIAKARRNAFHTSSSSEAIGRQNSPAAKPHRAETEAGSASPTALPAASDDGTTATEIGRV